MQVALIMECPLYTVCKSFTAWMSFVWNKRQKQKRYMAIFGYYVMSILLILWMFFFNVPILVHQSITRYGCVCLYLCVCWRKQSESVLIKVKGQFGRDGDGEGEGGGGNRYYLCVMTLDRDYTLEECVHFWGPNSCFFSF